MFSAANLVSTLSVPGPCQLSNFDDHVSLHFSLFVSNSKQSSGLCLPQHLQFGHSACFSSIVCCNLNLTAGSFVSGVGFGLLVPAVFGLLFLLFVLPPFFLRLFDQARYLSLHCFQHFLHCLYFLIVCFLL